MVYRIEWRIINHISLRVMVFESYEIHFISFCHSYLDLSHNFHAQICFHSHFFTAHTSLGCRKCLIGMLFDRKPEKLLSRTLYRTHVAAHVILKERKDDVMNNTLFEPLSNYTERERASKLTGLSKKRYHASKLSLRWFSRPRKPRSDGMKPCDFDKWEICINCKITHKQDNKLFI